jgi:hypothetical protein
MNRISLIGLSASLGLLLATGCGSEPPADPVRLPDDAVFGPPRTTSTSELAGFAWDPEAFYINLMSCGPECPPIRSMLSDLNPIFAYSKVQGSVIVVFDPILGAPAGFADAPTGPDAQWRVPAVPSRDQGPYFVVTGPPPGPGPVASLVQPPAGSVVAPIATTSYLPTFTARPIVARNTACYFQEAAHVGGNGVLDAVAKYRTAKGQTTAVADLMNPAKFVAVTVFWLWEPRDFPNLLTPATSTTIESSGGIKYHIGWAKPGTRTDQSARGFYVVDSAASSPSGITVILVPTGFPAPVVHYQVADTITNAEAHRPWGFLPLDVPPVPGQVTSISLQLFPGGILDGPAPQPPAFACVF